MQRLASKESIGSSKFFGLLARPMNFSSNHSVDSVLAKQIKSFYQDDAASRQTSNKKEVLHIEKQAMPIRYMSMTIGQAYTVFMNKLRELDPSGYTLKTIFYSLRPKWVKILTPHDLCACIDHEDFDFLIQV